MKRNNLKTHFSENIKVVYPAVYQYYTTSKGKNVKHYANATLDLGLALPNKHLAH